MGRPREHSRRDFVDAAVRIVDADGLEALTARRLGTEVGVSATAVYTYFPSRDDLLSALVDFVSAEATAGLTLDEMSPREVLESVAVSVRRVVARHPHLAPAVLISSGNLDEGLDAMLTVVSILEASGLEGDRLAQAYRVLENYVFGATLFDFGAAPDHLAIRRRRYLATKHAAFGQAAKSNKSVAAHNDEAFLAGFRALLDALNL